MCKLACSVYHAGQLASLQCLSCRLTCSAYHASCCCFVHVQVPLYWQQTLLVPNLLHAQFNCPKWWGVWFVYLISLYDLQQPQRLELLSHTEAKGIKWEAYIPGWMKWLYTEGGRVGSCPQDLWTLAQLNFDYAWMICSGHRQRKMIGNRM